MVRGLLGALGVLIALVGGTFFATFATEAATGGDGRTQAGTYVALIVFCGGLTAAGLYLAWRMLRPPAASSGAARPGSDGGARQARQAAPPASPPTTDAERERRVLRLAERERGRLTVAEVAARCHMTHDEAKATLDRLVVNEIAALHVTESGVLVYVFAGFLSDQDKARARDF